MPQIKAYGHLEEKMNLIKKWKKVLCWTFGHDWNKYSLKSSYGKALCNRCNIEVDRASLSLEELLGKD